MHYPPVPAHAGDAPPLDLTVPVVALRKGEPPAKKPVSHFDWATRIAQRIARWSGLKPKSQEESDVESVATFTLIRKLTQFTPQPEYEEGANIHGHFRGWVHMSLRAECLREAIRLRSGGLSPRTPPKGATPVVESLPTRRTENGVEEVEIADEHEGEPSPDFTEVCQSFRRKRRFDTETGEPIAEPAPPPLSYPAGEKPSVSGELLSGLLDLDELATE